MLSKLALQRTEDFRLKLAPENYRPCTTEDLLEAADTDDDVGIRKSISRIRREVGAGVLQLFEINLGKHAFIETVGHKKGYRLNPNVKIVGLDQLRN